ncbi:MAG: arginine--tRNA ligase [Gammaproteobacteria bacterium]
MRQHLKQLIITSISKIKDKKSLAVPEAYSIQIERTRDSRHGAFASNIAMTLAKHTGLKPRRLASEIVRFMPDSAFIEKVEIAGPGFINFFLNKQAYLQVIPDILNAGKNYGRCDDGRGDSILLEFVSANPTGPLHVGHGRGAAYGSSVANLLEATGCKISREYYVNDAGRQMDILAISVWLRYLALCGQDNPFPANAYQAAYVHQIAEKLYEDNGHTFNVPMTGLFTGEWDRSDDELQLDKLIAFARQHLGRENYQTIFTCGLRHILDDIRADLEEFGVTFDNWFSEQSLADNRLIDACMEKLHESGDLYEDAGARWFRSTRYGDEKDRVVERDNGQKTYFASDIAYHMNKFERGYNKIIDIWGADHHGYINRVKGALAALGANADALDVLLVQFVTLYRGTTKVQMSTRSGEYVTLRELRNEVGNDAARFFYVTRKSEQHLDFDLELAKSQSNDNPVYYIQYAHARICSVLHQMHERGQAYDREQALLNLQLLTEPQEQTLLTTLSRYPEVITNAADKYEPHQVGFYLRELANDFHSYYNTHQFLIKDPELRQARISLILGIQQVIRNGLEILGVSAPEKM